MEHRTYDRVDVPIETCSVRCRKALYTRRYRSKDATEKPPSPSLGKVKTSYDYLKALENESKVLPPSSPPVQRKAEVPSDPWQGRKPPELIEEPKSWVPLNNPAHRNPYHHPSLIKP